MATHKRSWTMLVAIAALVGVAPLVARANNAQLLDMSLEELLNLEVTSVSKKSQKVSETAAAVFVVTADDIRHSGARNVPEALQGVPGLQVAQIDGNKWAISARGFNGRFANKLLVLMNGRTLYTPSFSGVYWDVKDTVMEDIDRIEIIRGPGGTLWGSNAVNGVINIITKTAADTQGTFLSSSYSNQSSLSATARYGASFGEDVQYRVYAKYFDEDGNEDRFGDDTNDDWQMARTGLRLDWQPTESQSVSFSAEAYTGSPGESLDLATLTPPYVRRQDAVQDVSGYFVMADWTRDWSPESSTQARLYWDVADRDALLIQEDRETLDLDVQHRLLVGSRHDIVFGAGFRSNDIDYQETPKIEIRHEGSADLWNAFVQDEIALVQDRWYLTLGTKLEHNDRSTEDIELLPNARLLWNITDEHHAWAAVTRSVRVPSDAERHTLIRDTRPIIPPGSPENPAPVPAATAALGNHDMDSEELVSYEMGWRGRLSTRLSADMAVFFNDYDKLRANELGDTICEPSGVSVGADPLCVFSSTNTLTLLPFNNGIQAEAYGAELVVDWVATDQLGFRGVYSYLEMDADPDPGALNEGLVEDTSPTHQAEFRSEYSPVASIDVDLALRYIDDVAYYDIDSYWTADVRLAWRPVEALELEVKGKNLLDDSRLQFISEINDVTPTEIERSFVATVRWSF